MAQTVDLSVLSNKLKNANLAIGESSRAGDLVMKVGRVARPEWNIRQSPQPQMAAFTKLKLNDVVLVEQAMKGRPQDTSSWLYIYASPANGGQFVEGWVNSAGLLLDPPDPEAQVHYIKSGEKLIDIAAQYYKGGGFEWGDDARFYVAALAYANKDYSAMIFPAGWTDADFKERGRWADIGIKADHAIWIPTKAKLATLKGQFVNSGSLTYEMWQAVKKAAAAVWEAIVGFVGFVAGLLHGVLVSIWDIIGDIIDLAKMIYKVLKSIFTGELINDIKKLWDTVKNTDWKAAFIGMAEDFMAKWEAEDTWARYYFRGHTIGWVLGTVAIAILTAGLTLAGKAGKVGKLLKTLLNNPVVKAITENPAVKAITSKVDNALAKSAHAAEIKAAVKKLEDVLTFKGLKLLKGYDARMGIPEEHLKAMIEAAKETKVIAIFRANKAKAVPLIKKGAHGKPMWAKFKTDPDSGILRALEKEQIDIVHKNGHYIAAGDGYAYRNVAGQAAPEKIKVDASFPEVKQGHVLAPDGKPIVGDYDLLGVAPIESPGSNVSLVPDDLETGDWNGPWVKKYAEAVNKKGRLDEPRVLHGAQDAYGGNPKYVGLTDDTAYAVFPDGRTYVMEGKKAQQEFYDAIGRKAQSSGPAPVGRPGWHLEGDRIVR